ncbi:MAG: hypothetical protein IJR35_07795 [Synergistaceae bacterium]|nr:hypothetical protein [Synergistaceae bacterium]
MIRTVIDIGSNSIKMRTAKINKNKVNIIRDETEVVRLSRGMNSTGVLNPESMKRSCNTVARMVSRAKSSGVNKSEIFLVGTMALRTAKNADEFIKLVKEATGLDVHVFSGIEEAKYSWLGAVDGFNFSGSVIMFDTGGGSTEFVSGSLDSEAQGVKKVISVPVGAVNLSEKFFNERDKPFNKSTCDNAIEFVGKLFHEHDIASFRENNSHIHIIGVGGGVVAMSSVKNACESFMPSKLHGSVLTTRDIVRQIRMYASLTLSERENIIGLPASRADVILGSACIIFEALKILNADSCIVSINGLRHGLLLRDDNINANININ